MKRTIGSGRLGSRKPRHRDSSANRTRQPISSRRRLGLSTKSRMVTTKAAAKAIQRARSAESRDNAANRMKGAKPTTRFMLALQRIKKAGRRHGAPRPVWQKLLSGCGRRGGARIGLALHKIGPEAHHAGGSRI